MIYTGYVKVASGKSQTGRVKLKISPGTEEAFLWVKGENHPGRVSLGLLQRGVRMESKSGFMNASHNCKNVK